MTSTAFDLNEDSLLFLDFDPEVSCEQAKQHDHGRKWYHAGPTKATHYVKGVCAGCRADLGVSPCCEAYVTALRGEVPFFWKHTRCGHVNRSQDTVTIVGTI